MPADPRTTRDHIDALTRVTTALAPLSLDRLPALVAFRTELGGVDGDEREPDGEVVVHARLVSYAAGLTGEGLIDAAVWADQLTGAVMRARRYPDTADYFGRCAAVEVHARLAGTYMTIGTAVDAHTADELLVGPPAGDRAGAWADLDRRLVLIKVGWLAQARAERIDRGRRLVWPAGTVRTA